VQIAVAGYEMGVADVCDDVVRSGMLCDPGSVHGTRDAFLTTLLAGNELYPFYRRQANA
jgi:hypothetical protein